MKLSEEQLEKCRNVIDGVGLIADFDWRAYQEKDFKKVRQIDALMERMRKAAEKSEGFQ